MIGRIGARVLVIALAVPTAGFAEEPSRNGSPMPAADRASTGPAEGSADAFPSGRWMVTFANGVIETCEVREDGAVLLNEPRRCSSGKAHLCAGDVVIEYADDRTERWARVGSRMVVEHWFPSAAFPAARPVLGIAERAE
jgi:hypothetical protein